MQSIATLSIKHNVFFFFQNYAESYLWQNTTRIINSGLKNSTATYRVNNFENNDLDYSMISRNLSKAPKGFVLNKTVWPSHTNKDINTYTGTKSEPKYYLGMQIQFKLNLI